MNETAILDPMWAQIVAGAVLVALGWAARWVIQRNQVKDRVIRLEDRVEVMGEESSAALARHEDRMEELDKRQETIRMEIERDIRELEAKSMSKNEVLAHLKRLDEKQDATISALKDIRDDIRLNRSR